MTVKLLDRLIRLLVVRKDKPLPEVFDNIYKPKKTGVSIVSNLSPSEAIVAGPGNKEQIEEEICSVYEMRTGSRGKVVFLTAGQNGRMDRLTALGVIPGNFIRVVQKYPSLVVCVDYTEIAIDRESAQEIYVKIEPAIWPAKPGPKTSPI
jgi:Fe2+ transport system protein FeoA